MWIKTANNELLNTDYMESIWYDEKNNVTRSWYRNDYRILAKNNIVPIIATAIQQGKTFVGVQ